MKMVKVKEDKHQFYNPIQIGLTTSKTKENLSKVKRFVCRQMANVVSGDPERFIFIIPVRSHGNIQTADILLWIYGHRFLNWLLLFFFVFVFFFTFMGGHFSKRRNGIKINVSFEWRTHNTIDINTMSFDHMVTLTWLCDGKCKMAHKYTNINGRHPSEKLRTYPNRGGLCRHFSEFWQWRRNLVFWINFKNILNLFYSQE